MPHLHPNPSAHAHAPHAPFADHLSERARNRLHAEPPRIIEIGEIAAGIAVPEPGGVRFFSSARAFDGLDGTLFRSAEQAARAARARARTLGAV